MMSRLLPLLLILIWPTLTVGAQPDASVQALFAKFRQAARFDYNFPREKVYLHLDNTSYLEGDTLWYKAYVVRASTLRPTTLSKVLYVELLHADGQLMERQTLLLDSLGQADGAISLALPLRAGYYEVRAYTREMLNWPDAGYFSRVIPVFGARDADSPRQANRWLTLDDLYLPAPEAQRRVTRGAPRPNGLGSAQQVELHFYPEGGLRAAHLPQRVAYELTDGRGNPLTDSLTLFTSSGQRLLTSVPEHSGRGTFLLPPNQRDAYVCVGSSARRFALPPAAAHLTLRADHVSEGLLLTVAADDSAATAAPCLGLAVMCREQMTYFDTLTLQREPIELLVPHKALRGGVNRIELFDAEGHSLASRLVWCHFQPGTRPVVQARVQQNATAYDAFTPAMLRITLTDAEGHPVQAPLSVAVRDADALLTHDADAGMASEWLLASEVRGYIAQPALYFARRDARHERMLDLLLLVQGWRANTFDVMCGTDSFKLRQPIEEQLLLRGTLFSDNHKRKPLPGMSLDVKMYSLQGGALEGNVVTDAEGRFAFTSNVNYVGDYMAQFTMRNADGKKHWSRLTLDRWFTPTLRPLRDPSLVLHLPQPASLHSDTLPAPATFAWTDTIPQVVKHSLGEAVVTVKKKYKGFTGNRYTYNGGELHGQRRATKFYNVLREMERSLDEGLELGDLWSFIHSLDADYYFDREHDGALDAPADNNGRMPEISHGLTGGEEAPGLNAGGDNPTASMLFRNRATTIYLNNKPLSESDRQGLWDAPPVYWVQSMAIVKDGLVTDALTGERANVSKSRYSMYLYETPDAYRYKPAKGVERRSIQGFTPHTAFYAPDYRLSDLPNAADRRRTLMWVPNLRPNAQGVAHVLLYTNAHDNVRLDISLRGLTPDGRVVEQTR